MPSSIKSKGKLAAFVQHGQVIFKGNVIGHCVTGAQKITSTGEAGFEGIVNALADLALTGAAKEIYIDAAQQ